MEDKEIVRLFWDRSQQAVEAVQEKYGSRLLRLAANLLGDRRDAEECVNDACLGAWRSIPPNRPDPLLPYLYKILRNLCLKRRRSLTAQKRGGGDFDAALSELENTLSSPGGPAEELDLKELTALLDRFLQKLPRKDRVLFLGRYWFGESYESLSARLGFTENNAMVRMNRIRNRLKQYLLEQGAL